MEEKTVIQVSNSDAEQINNLTLSELERDILQSKDRSPVVYQYNSLEALEFELKMRTSIVEVAAALNASGVTFATFQKSRCNEQFWSRTETGGFRLRSGVLPSDGIDDFFRNGRLYAFECATAIMIILYRAILDAINVEAFNVHFKDLYLRDWNSDKDLRLISTYNKYEAYPGDGLYFKNPDHAPETPEWQGENAVLLGADLYYGHGIGIGSSEKMIFYLNKLRKPGSMTSAFLTDLVIHPDFEFLRMLSPRGKHLVVPYKHLENAIVVRIGTHNYGN
jgi:protein-glutamine gamma-glutamyltransferase